jgi:hypothetical protein
MLRLVTPNGRMAQHWKWLSSTNMTLSRTVVTEVIPRKDTRRFALIWYLTASTMVNTKPGWLQMAT